MALRLREVTLTLEEDESLLAVKVSRELGLESGEIGPLKVIRRGIDARKKPRIFRVYTVEFTVPDEAQLLRRQKGNSRLEHAPTVSPPPVRPPGVRHRALVVGMGPAGLFAALRLARHGVSVVLAERGRPVEDRVRDVRRFWKCGDLDPGSNVQFGEGGAGTFSDGKLTTRVNHPWTRLVLDTLVDLGAPEAILVEARPHVGTDCLRRVLINCRRSLQDLGVEILYESLLSGFGTVNGRVNRGLFEDGREVACDSLVLAPGHSARDTYRMLQECGVRLESKPFAVGVRVEHPVERVNFMQYGMKVHPRLPAAEYTLSYNDRASGRGIYSFCMCPGGEVVIASSEPDGLVVNGMSWRDRGGALSNSALVVAVGPADFDGADPLAGMRFQRQWEERAFRIGGGDYRAPAQNMLAFLGRGQGPLRSSARPGIREADLTRALPDFVVDGLRRALPRFDRRMRGFISSEATLVGIETRTSAPLRILRGADGQSLSHPGLYPAGEGAGYAGGIMSAALDGLRTAEQIVENLLNRSCK